MIDEYSLSLDGWARFSKDERHRYRLARMLTPMYQIAIVDGRVMGMAREVHPVIFIELERVVFLMLNPSIANALKLDPTVDKCRKFAQRWGAQVLEVVNLFSFRSPYPQDLDIATNPGDDEANDEAILTACAGAKIVIAAWGAGGYRRGRADIIRDRLKHAGVTLHHLGTTQEGRPLHPLARGKHFIPLERAPEVWV